MNGEPADASGPGARAARACVLIAGLALLALAAQPAAQGARVQDGWRLAVGIDRGDDARRWVLHLPLAPEQIEDGPLLIPATPRGAGAPQAPSFVDLRSYPLDAVREGEALVPRLLLERLPEALRDTEAGDLRKRLFIKAMLPALLAENESVLDRRARLADLFDARRAGHRLLDSERLWLERIAESYGAGPDDEEELLRRVDVVPPSLALAQAALESGWGTSRGAQKAHSMFGHMSVAPDPARSVLRQFERMPDAVAAYVHNLNTHRAYAPFRETRARQRARNLPADGHALAGALLRYSERGDSYVRDVRALIRTNRLDDFDRARLGG
jgi:Bax protein